MCPSAGAGGRRPTGPPGLSPPRLLRLAPSRPGVCLRSVSSGRRPSPPRVSFAEAARTCAFNGHLHADGLQPSSSRPNLFSGFQAHIPMCLAANVSLFPTAERIHPGLSPRVSEDALAPKKKKKNESNTLQNKDVRCSVLRPGSRRSAQQGNHRPGCSPPFARPPPALGLVLKLCPTN